MDPIIPESLANMSGPQLRNQFQTALSPLPPEYQDQVPQAKNDGNDYFHLIRATKDIFSKVQTDAAGLNDAERGERNAQLENAAKRAHGVATGKPLSSHELIHGSISRSTASEGNARLKKTPLDASAFQPLLKRSA